MPHLRRYAAGALVAIFVAAGCTPFGSIAGLPASTSRSSTRPVARRPRPLATLQHSGRWFTDPSGRVVMLRGMNFVEKFAPFTPEADGFGDDDAALLVANGFNAIRLGVPFGFLMPAPGRIDRNYLASIERTVRILDRHHIYVLLDFHQDGWGPVTHGNGMPGWMTYTDGLPNPPDGFPGYYVTNPALQRAFENFWANRPGPNGIALQAYYAFGMRAVAQRFAAADNVLGYEAMNEPWPGADWSSCASGCPDLEARLLAPFYARVTAAVRTVDRRHPVFVEPFVLFNFGKADTALPGATTKNALSTHVYSDAAGNAAAMDRSVAAATRDKAPVHVTEWGSVADPPSIVTTADQFDARLVPWMYWSYNGLVVADSNKSLVAPNLDIPVLDALTRPYPTVINGTPTHLAYDAASTTLTFTYSTTKPDGRRAYPGLGTAVKLPARDYPDGYSVVVVGADVTSRRCAPVLTLRNHRRAATVYLRVTPAKRHC